nr:putative reverse transcriptase domain, viral movement protein [Tanacetum cinerariifolium]
FSSDDDSDTDSLEGDSDFGVHMINPISHVLPIQEDPPLPLAKIHLLTDAYAKPIPVIAFFDTGSSVPILNPNILPDHYWKPHHQSFMAANGEKFVIDKISHLADAKVLSKFDLLSGFWQLGIKPEDRLKTAFCIPDHHYQWKVMPFGLKNAPSAFQKAMITIFEPILANTLVYIDDILLFSPDEQSHAELLSKFYSLVTKYRIMLSKKKMEVEVTTIQFLGLEISDGRYQPQPHVAQELLKFPDELSSQKMIQQFLGLVNYMADFLPKLSHHTVWLFPMLKKNPPQWTSRQTEAVKAIKSLAEKMPPLKIPASSEKRILQTDASDECWG